MEGQISIFDWMPESRPEPQVGEWVTEHGAAIPHIMRPSYIGKKVVMDKSTTSHKWYKVGILEAYVPYEEYWRSIVYDGHQGRNYITHYPGVEIYECLPWESYPERNKGGKA